MNSIRFFWFDVDGVLTDGRILLAPTGEEWKSFHVKDGVGIKKLQQVGIQVGILSGRHSQAVSYRAKELGIESVIQGVSDKQLFLQDWLAEKMLSWESLAYMGDDEADLEVMKRVKCAIAPQDAIPALHAVAHYVTQAKGGEGAVREAAEWLLSYYSR
jgi:3-deoxy-D-manno-octulosonate 8-phosphate phosphatase (KDO 8-P phosphatase)